MPSDRQQTNNGKAFYSQVFRFQMGGLLVVFSLLVAVTTYADDLQVLKAAAKSYVDAMKAVLALPDELDCSETITKANEYAVAKVAYYNAARQAMPALLEIAKRTRD